MSHNSECPVCGSRLTQEFLRQSAVPVHQNLLFSTPSAARVSQRGELAMCCCSNCGFVFNSAFDPSLLSYGAHYDNTQTHSPAFGEYVDGLVKHLVEKRDVRDSVVVEVGCGKGDFLRRLVTYPNSGNRGLGFDPTYEGAENDQQGRLEFHRRFYDQSCTEYRADAVVCRHVIEHVEQPLVLLRAVRKALDRSPHARVFFETPCVEWILRNEVLWDFFYEHCSLFTENSITTAFQRTGFEVVSVRHVFGGQYLWLEGRPTTETLVRKSPSISEIETPQKAQSYGQTRQTKLQVWSDRLAELREQGGVALWGAGAKGVTFANLCDSQAQFLDYVVDVNPNKQGRYLAGTGHRIIGPHELPKNGLAAVLVLNPNYVSEVRASLTQHGHTYPVVNLMDWNEQATSEKTDCELNAV